MSTAPPRPLELVFVRHGESEANLAARAARQGDPSAYTPEFRHKPQSEMELTPLGVKQALAAGQWIRQNIHSGVFARYFTSPYTRARHTAAHLRLPEAEQKPVWDIRDELREQSYGYFDNIPDAELLAKYPDIMQARDRDGAYWERLGGESLAALMFRVKLGIIATMYRKAPAASVIAVSHGNLMWAVRLLLETLTYADYYRLKSASPPFAKIHNCQILQYTRVNPESNSDVSDHFSYVRSICPWDESRSDPNWQKITRRRYSNSDLLA